MPKDLGKAVQLYQKAADQGNDIAQYNLGLLYENGKGVPKDLAQGSRALSKSGRPGNGLPRSIISAGSMKMERACRRI